MNKDRDSLDDAPKADTVEHLQARLTGLSACLPGFAFRRRMNADGEISYPWFSNSISQILGFAPEQMAVNAQGCLHAVHWADRDRHVADIRRSAADLSICDEEIRMVTQAGQICWLKGASRPHRADDGGLEWDGVLIDVTEGKRAEFRLDMLMEHAADCILIMDEDGRIDSANTAAELLFGFTAQELAGKTVADLLAPEFDNGRLLEAQDGQDPTLPGGVPREVLGRRNGGELFPLEISTTEVRMEGRRLFVGIGRDITQRKAVEKALHDSEQRLSAITGNMPGMVFQRVMTPDGALSFSYVSEGCRNLMGLEPAELIAEPDLLTHTMSEEDREAFEAALHHSARTLEPLDEERAVFGPDRRRRWLRGQSRPTRLEDGTVVWDGVMLDVSERKAAEKRLSFLAYYDPLTRLPNRAAFVERLEAAVESDRAGGTRSAVLSMGIDRFGIINATMGHSVGDQVLTAAADIIQAGLGRGDMMARASGDRFLVLIAGRADRKELTDSVERIHALGQSAVYVGSEEFEVSSSIGVALHPRDGASPDDLIRAAESALQRAKSQGPATLQYFTKEMSDKAAKTLSLQNKLRRALEHGELLPFYQPQVDLGSGQVVGMEALVRWISPEMGMIPPVEFIPVAEESGLIDSICEVMLMECARQNREWQDQGLPAVPVAVNVSGRQFQYARRLIASLETSLQKSGLEPRYLEVELTESSAMRDADSAIAVVQTLKDMGISCAIDDFGTGYSSLSVLKRFPISKLKIDRSFVMDVITDPNDAAIVDAIIAMAKALKMKVVAEGVEHNEHLEFLRSLGCDQIQGYLFSRPLPADEMGKLLKSGKRLRFSNTGKIAASG